MQEAALSFTRHLNAAFHARAIFSALIHLVCVSEVRRHRPMNLHCSILGRGARCLEACGCHALLGRGARWVCHSTSDRGARGGRV